MPKQPAHAIRNFFVGNIAYDSDEETLREFLVEQTGIEFPEVKICKDKETQKPRGFGFVTLGSRDTIAIEEAIEAVDGLIFHGRTLHAAKANERAPKTPPVRRSQSIDHAPYCDVWEEG